MDDNSTMLFFFNQRLVQDYGLESPYDLLDGNRWTTDEYAKLVRAVSTDLNGDGIMDENDRFGNVLAYHYIQYMVQGAGMRYAELDSDGFPHITFHQLRHTHISLLIANDVDITTVSKRVCHKFYWF
jgi:integrase